MSWLRDRLEQYDRAWFSRASDPVNTLCMSQHSHNPSNCAARQSHEVFQLDSFEDRQVLYADILPALYDTHMPINVLFVGMQAYCLRYEYMFARHGIALTTLEVRPTGCYSMIAQRQGLHALSAIRQIARASDPDMLHIIAKHIKVPSCVAHQLEGF